MLRTDGGGQEADPAPHKTEPNAQGGQPMPAPPTKAENAGREQAEADVAPKPAPAKSSDAGFGSFG